jgi:serine/threonine-protein kinase
LNKEPPRRYASARALADDLRRFERGEPIAARPLGRLGRLARWARRRPTAAALAAALVVTALLALALVGDRLWLSGQRQATALAAEDDLREADGLLQQSDLAGARAALERAKGRLGAGGTPELQHRLGQVEAALTLHQQLDAIRLHRSVLFETELGLEEPQMNRDYEEVFQAAGLGTDQEDEETVAARVSGLRARKALVTALDDWASCTRAKRRRAWLLKVARLADPDPWRDRARDPAAWEDRAKLTELTDTAPVKGQSLALLLALGQQLDRAGGDPRPFLRRVQSEHPNDFWANNWLGDALMSRGEAAVAIGFFRTALALRPDTTLANSNLGLALHNAGQPDEAIHYLERAVQIDPLAFTAHYNLAAALELRGLRDEALTHYREAVRLKPTGALAAKARNNLAVLLDRMGRGDDALPLYEENIRLNPGNELWHRNLAGILATRGRRDEAAEHYRAALAINPNSAPARHHLGLVLLAMGRPKEAADHLRQALALEPGNRTFQEDWRRTLIRLGRLEDARAAWRQTLESSPPQHDIWFGYAELCLFLGQEGEYRRARRDLLARFAGSTDPAVCERTGRACLLLPGTQEDLEDAAALTNRAVAAGRKGREWEYPYYLFAKGLADYRLGRYDDAIAVMSGEAAKAEYVAPSQRLITAIALQRKEKKDEALKTLAAAILSYDWSAAKADSRDPWIAHVLRREAEASILPNLPAFLNGAYQPQDNDERLALLGVCQFKELRAAEAGLLAAAFAVNRSPAEDMRTGLRYRAARAAAVAGCGGGADGAKLSDAERARWREQARGWLREEFAECSKLLQATPAADRAKKAETLKCFKNDPDLAGLREPDALDKLPPQECQKCRALWGDLDSLLRAAPSAK